LTEVKSLDQLTLVAAFIIPGLIATFIRAQFLTGRIGSGKDSLLIFFTVSVVWYGLSAPFITWLGQTGIAPYARPWQWLVLTVVGPAAFGALLGLNASCGWSQLLLAKCGMHVVHGMPTAWDWKFGKAEACWILLTMKDGSKVAGFCGRDSFISSDSTERDVYIGRVYSLDENDAWIAQGEKGILVLHGEIRCIEFWPYRLAKETFVDED
jgi:Family of unknown function (DUF6338)